MFAFDVPQRDVHCTDGTAQRSPTKRTHAVEVLPVMLNPQGILPDEVFLKRVDDAINGFWIAPASGLSHTTDTGIRMNSDHIAVPNKKRLNFINFHITLL